MGFHAITDIMFICGCTVIIGKVVLPLSLIAVLYVWGTKWRWECKGSTDFIYQRSRALFFGPMWSNLLSQHRHYTARHGCQLLQTGQILIKRSGYKKNPWFVCFFFLFFLEHSCLHREKKNCWHQHQHVHLWTINAGKNKKAETYLRKKTKPKNNKTPLFFLMVYLNYKL